MVTRIGPTGEEMMKRPYSPSPRWLAVPGIGFPQNVSGAPNAPDLAAFRYRTITGFAELRKLPVEIVRRDNEDDLPPQLTPQNPPSWLSFLARRWLVVESREEHL
jgi:hypothetical protein